jgi:hypothetical protein
MFPVEPAASSRTGEWVQLAWSKGGWGKGQVSRKLTQGRHWYKLQTHFLLSHNYVSNVQWLAFVNQPPDELRNHIGSRLEWEFSTFLPAMYVQTIYLSAFETPWFLPHLFSSFFYTCLFASLLHTVFKLFSTKMQKHFNDNKMDENKASYFASITPKCFISKKPKIVTCLRCDYLFFLFNNYLWKGTEE